MKSFLRLFVLFAFLSACSVAGAQKITTAIQLNDYLAGITDSLFIGGKEWGTAFAKANENGTYSTIATHRIRLSRFIDNKRIEVVTMKDINGSGKLRLAMLDFLSFEARMIREAFQPFEKFTSSTPSEDIQKAIVSLQNKSAEEGTYLDEVRAAQIEYGKKNGFTIQEEEE
ncbi:MAG: hypothetical protein J0L56_15120 [Chitinophagales bacterium]|nr:hypothetical protein [Chitinophagales bacterium]